MNEDLGGFQGCLKEAERVFQISFQDVSRKFQGNFKGVSRKIVGYSERPLRVIQGSFKVSKRSSTGVSRQFQKCLKKVLSVFTVQRKFQVCFK